MMSVIETLTKPPNDCIVHLWIHHSDEMNQYALIIRLRLESNKGTCGTVPAKLLCLLEGLTRFLVLSDKPEDKP